MKTEYNRAGLKKYIVEILEAIGKDSKSATYYNDQASLIIAFAKKVDERETYEASNKNDVDEVYDAYPTKCVVQGRNLGKSFSDKTKIASLLNKNTKEKLLLTIQRYVEECKRDKVYMKNLSSFLNKIPEYDLTEKPKTVEISGYRDLRKITEAQ